MQGHAWEAAFNVPAASATAERPTGPTAHQLLNFSCMYRGDDAVCFQAGAGIRLREVNRLTGELIGVDMSACYTGYMLVKHIVPGFDPLQDWCFPADARGQFARLADAMVGRLLAQPQLQRFLAVVRDDASYLAAVEKREWPFLTVVEPHIVALLHLGRGDEAAVLAHKALAECIRDAAGRGAPLREDEVQLFRSVIQRVGQGAPANEMGDP